MLITCLQVEDDLDRIRNAQNQQELMTSFKDFGRSLGELNDRAGRRQMVRIQWHVLSWCWQFIYCLLLLSFLTDAISEWLHIKTGGATL